jgi:hypothetical protein
MCVTALLLRRKTVLTSVMQPAHVYLNEDGLELWQILLRRSSSLSTEMLGLLPVLVTILGTGMDILPRCLLILESYLLLDAATVLSVRYLCLLCGGPFWLTTSHSCAPTKSSRPCKIFSTVSSWRRSRSFSTP